MALDLFVSLGFSLQDYSGAKILNVSSPWHQQYPELFSGLECLTAFRRKPLLDPNGPPVIQPLRQMPLALRKDIEEDIQWQSMPFPACQTW